GVPQKLAALYRGFVLEAEIIGGDGAPAQFDYHIPMASLMLALQSRIESIPAPTPYLKAEPERVAAWRTRLGSDGFRIGIAWQGARVSNDIGRSFPLSLFGDIAALE